MAKEVPSEAQVLEWMESPLRLRNVTGSPVNPIALS